MSKKTYYTIFITLFFIVASSPFWGMLLSEKNNSAEKRTFEEFKYITGFGSFNKYLLDHHGFRNFFTSTYIKSYISLFKESPIPNNVIFGKDDWLFVGDYYNDTYSSALGVLPTKEDEIDEIVNQVKSIRNFCDSIDCEFYLIIAPNKNSIYSEYLPIKPNNQPKLRELIVPKLEKAHIKVLDLYPFLEERKSQNLLYYKTDTHWNSYAGLMVSKYINDYIRNSIDLDSISVDSFIINEIDMTEYGDLSGMLGENNFQDKKFIVTDKRNIILEDTIIGIKQESGSLDLILHTLNKSVINKSKAIIFRDSFFDALYNPFVSSIHESTLIKKYPFDTNTVKKIMETYGKPDFILYEVAERNINMIEYQ